MSDRKTGASFVATLVAATPVIKHEEDDDKGMIVLNTTAEFCRNIGEEEAVTNMEEESVEIKLEGDNETIEEEEEEMVHVHCSHVCVVSCVAVIFEKVEVQKFSKHKHKLA